MTLFEGIRTRIGTAFCLSIARRVVAKLLLNMTEADVFKVLLVVTTFVNFISKGLTVEVSDSPMVILRQTCMIALAQSLIRIANIDDNGNNEHSMWLPWGPLVQSITRSVLVVLAISWASGALLKFPMFRQFEPEVRRVSVSLQYMFADEVAPLLLDPILKRVVFAIGLAGMQLTARPADHDEITAASILYGSAGMVWANVVLNILSPGSNQLLYLSITVDVAVVCFLSVAGSRLSSLYNLMPYIEWYVARDIIRIFTQAGGDTYDIMISGFITTIAIAIFIRAEMRKHHALMSSLLSISSILTSSLVAEEIVQRFDNSLADVVTGTFLASIFFKSVILMLRRVIDSE